MGALPMDNATVILVGFAAFLLCSTVSIVFAVRQRFKPMKRWLLASMFFFVIVVWFTMQLGK
jgi:hypothetical protein